MTSVFPQCVLLSGPAQDRGRWSVLFQDWGADLGLSWTGCWSRPFPESGCWAPGTQLFGITPRGPCGWNYCLIVGDWWRLFASELDGAFFPAAPLDMATGPVLSRKPGVTPTHRRHGPRVRSDHQTLSLQLVYAVSSCLGFSCGPIRHSYAMRASNAHSCYALKADF